jgi:hypothetical protein
MGFIGKSMSCVDEGFRQRYIRFYCTNKWKFNDYTYVFDVVQSNAAYSDTLRHRPISESKHAGWQTGSSYNFGMEQNSNNFNCHLRIFDITQSKATYGENVRCQTHFQIARTACFAAAILVCERQSALQCAALCGIQSGNIENTDVVVRFASISCSEPKL